MIQYDELIPNIKKAPRSSWVHDIRPMLRIKGSNIMTNNALGEYINDMHFHKFMLARVKKGGLLLVFRDEHKAPETSRTFTVNTKNKSQCKCSVKGGIDPMLWGLYEVEFNCLQEGESLHNLVLLEAIKNIKK